MAIEFIVFLSTKGYDGSIEKLLALGYRYLS